MTTLNYGLLAEGFVTTSGGSTTEWFVVPADHEYIGELKVAHIGTSGSGTTSYRMAIASSSGAAPTNADYFTPLNIDLYEKDAHTYTIELDAGKALSVTPESTHISFNFTGMDKDNS